MPECCRTDQEVAIAAHKTGSSQTAALFAKDFAGILINVEDCQCRIPEALQRGFALSRVTGILHTLVEFCEGDDGEGKTLGGIYLQASRDAFDMVQMVNDPIGINEILHSLGSGRVLMSRSA